MKWASPNGYLEKEKKEVAGNGKKKRCEINNGEERRREGIRRKEEG